MRKPTKIFYRSLVSCLLIIGFGIYLSIRGVTPKTEFASVTGKIDYLDKTFEDITYRDKGDHRFIHIADYPLVFDVFIGMETFDLSPKFEQIDQLAVGDEITIYYADNTPLQRNEHIGINKTVQFIDMDDDVYFIRGNKDKYGGYALIAVGLLLVFTLFILKRFGKIK
ncbi:MAG: hypothetical protein WA775_12585 [Psychroserpens sp.]|uniref:hypothetical protein n=1 Tax=Psychroserpens sp. TaxID=2020870 RepID=UPI003C7811F1